MRRIALIPARGGSKRLPRKNIVDFRGRPIIAYTIEAARECGLFAHMVVSTEDDEIADVARRFGAEVHDRPPKLASDTSGVVDVCLDVLARNEETGNAYDVMCCLYPTAPLRTADDITATVRLVRPGECDFAMAVTNFTHSPHQALRVVDGDCLERMWPDLIERRAEQIGELVVGNGSTYAVAVQAFRRHRTFYGPGLRGYIMPRERSVDIDTAADLDFALYYAERATQ